MSRSPLTIAKKAGSVLSGFASGERRLNSAQRLHAFVLNSRDPAQIERHLEFAPRLTEQSLEGARLYPDRVAMLAALPIGGIVAEVGTWKGEFSRLIATICKPDRFHLIDIDFGPLEPVPMPVEKHEGDSPSILAQFAAGHFDWLYIDADHSYEGVTRDLAAAHRVLKPGGFLMCNDYTNWCSTAVTPYGVARAVNELILNEGYSVAGLALHPAGLYDILIRKP